MKLKERIENALYQPYGFRYRHEDWNPKLWNKSQQEIKRFLLDRFEKTVDVEEYYGTMCLLYHTVPNKNLLIEFKNSPQMCNHLSNQNTPNDHVGSCRIIKGSQGNVRIMG